MRQHIFRLLIASGLVSTLSLMGCTADPESSQAPASATDTGSPADTSSSADTGALGGVDGAGQADAVDDSGGTPDTGVTDPCATCTDNQICKDNTCEDKKPPCGGKCAAGEVCDINTDKCTKTTCALPAAKTLIDNNNINKIIKLTILTDKQGCDLDGDAAPDNVLGKVVGIYPAANDSLIGAVKDGSLVILLAPDAWKTDKTAFATDLLIGDVDPATKGCDATAADKCKYTVAASSYNKLFAGSGTCPPLVTFNPTVVDKNQLKAGGAMQVFQLNLPVVGINLQLKITQAQITGTVTDDKAWKDTKNGMLCGVLSEKDLNNAIDAVPASVLKATGFDKATIKALIGGVMKPDIDTNGSGTPDAISVALGIETVAVPVTGYTNL